METMEAQTVRLIYAYSQEDKKMRDELSKFMDSYPHLQQWHEDNILAGTLRLEEIRKNMASADIILLLLSADFLMVSKDIWQLALDLHQSNGTHIIPVHLSHFILPPELKDVQALPRNGIPINKWNPPDEAYVEIAQEVNKVVQGIHAQRTKIVTNVSDQTKVPTIPLSTKPLSLIQQKSLVTMSRRKLLTIAGSVGLIGATAGTLGYEGIIYLKSLKDIRIIFIQSAISTTLDPAPLTNALQQQSGLSVTLEFHPKTYGESITRFGSGEFNVLWDSAYGYIITAARYGALPALQLKGPTNDRSHYYSHILTKRSSNIRAIPDLKGRSLSLVDRYSGSGYLYPRYALYKNGLDETQVHTTYVETHTQSLDSVISGKTDAGAVSEEYYKSADGNYVSEAYKDTLSKYNVKDEDILSIYTSDPIPMGPLVVHSDILDSDVRRLQSAFLLLDDPTLLRSLGISGFGSVTDSVYDPIRQVAHELGIDLAHV